MKGKWEISWQTIGDKEIFQVVRVRDISAVKHSGNFEYYDEVFDSEAAAQAAADKLNRGDLG